MRLKTKFQDEDFDLGEVVEANVYYGGNGRVKVTAEAAKGGDHTFYFETLKGMNELFEDYEEPKSGIKDVWFPDVVEGRNNVVISFEIREEAEKAVEKLKAWHKLMDYWGTEVLGWEIRDMPTGGNWQTVNVKFNVKTKKEPMELLDIVFGGEE